jgi:hypothetical protein
MPITNAQERFLTELCMGHDAEYLYVESRQQMWQIVQTTSSGRCSKGTWRPPSSRYTTSSSSSLGWAWSRSGCTTRRSRSRHRRQMATQEAQEGPLRDRVITAAQLKGEHVEVAG